MWREGCTCQKNTKWGLGVVRRSVGEPSPFGVVLLFLCLKLDEFVVFTSLWEIFILRSYILSFREASLPRWGNWCGAKRSSVFLNGVLCHVAAVVGSHYRCVMGRGLDRRWWAWPAGEIRRNGFQGTLSLHQVSTETVCLFARGLLLFLHFITIPEAGFKDSLLVLCFMVSDLVAVNFLKTHQETKWKHLLGIRIL